MLAAFHVQHQATCHDTPSALAADVAPVMYVAFFVSEHATRLAPLITSRVLRSSDWTAGWSHLLGTTRRQFPAQQSLLPQDHSGVLPDRLLFHALFCE